MNTRDELLALLREVMQWHSDPENGHYNECDTDPCAWCQRAHAAIARLPSSAEAEPVAWMFAFADDFDDVFLTPCYCRRDVVKAVADWMFGDAAKVVDADGQHQCEGVADELLRTGVFRPEGDKPCFLHKAPWLSAPPSPLADPRVQELVEAAQQHDTEYTSGQHHNDEGRRYKATQRLHAALRALSEDAQEKQG